MTNVMGYILMLYLGVGLGCTFASSAQAKISHALFCIFLWPLIVVFAMLERDDFEESRPYYKPTDRDRLSD